MSLTQSGVAGIRKFTILGQDISPYVNKLQVFESLCKPYLTAKATIVDDNLIVDGLHIKGMEPVSFTCVADGGQEYSQTLAVFAISKEGSSVNKRALVYHLDLIGAAYFNERAHLVAETFSSIIGTSIIQTIHDKYVGGGLSIVVPSDGLLYQKNNLVIDKTKPFLCIDEVRKIITYSQYKAGVNCYYCDKDGIKLAPAEYLFANAKGGPVYTQKATWGASWLDHFNSFNAIVDLTVTLPNEGPQSGTRTSIDQLLAAYYQEYKVFDTKQNKMAIEEFKHRVSDPITDNAEEHPLVDAAASKSIYGGLQQYLVVDSDKIPIPNVRRTDIEALFRAVVSNSPQIFLKVPIQGGLQSTVGQGCTLNVLPPIGDAQTGSPSQSELSGPALVADIEHDFCNDQQLSFTTMRVVKGGFKT